MASLTKLANRLGLHTEAQAFSRELAAGRRVAHAASLHQHSLLSVLATNDVASWQADGCNVLDLLGMRMQRV